MAYQIPFCPTRCPNLAVVQHTTEVESRLVDVLTYKVTAAFPVTSEYGALRTVDHLVSHAKIVRVDVESPTYE